MNFLKIKVRLILIYLTRSTYSVFSHPLAGSETLLPIALPLCCYYIDPRAFTRRFGAHSTLYLHARESSGLQTSHSTLFLRRPATVLVVQFLRFFLTSACRFLPRQRSEYTTNTPRPSVFFQTSNRQSDSESIADWQSAHGGSPTDGRT